MKSLVQQHQSANLLSFQTMNKQYDSSSSNVIKPSGDYAAGKKELVDANSKDVSGAISSIEKSILPSSNAGVMDRAKQALSGVITETMSETEIHAVTEQKQASYTQVVGNLQPEAGKLSETETVVGFAPGYPPASWERSVGKRVEIRSKLNMGGQAASNDIALMGKNNSIIGQGQVSINEAMFANGNAHTAEIINIESIEKNDQGFLVTMKLGNRKKLS